MIRSAQKTRMAERHAAWTAAKLAVGRYAREPSESNEVKVRSAWLRVRHAMSDSVGHSATGPAKRRHRRAAAGPAIDSDQAARR